MPPVTRAIRPAPSPDVRPTYPWRFSLGQTVYTFNPTFNDSFTVVGGELWLGFPHLLALDRDGRTWRLPQLHCSSKPPTSL